MTRKPLKILIAAGGSGGHLFPAQQLSLTLQSDCEILFAGYKLASSPFFESEKIPFKEIASAPLKKGFLRALWKGFWQSVSLMRSFCPDVVVGFGSYHTFPLLLAAALMRKKIILFEANSTLGKVNRFFYPFAKRIAFQFPSSQKKGALVPFLPWVISQRKEVSIGEARQYFGLHPEKRTFLVFGGSQGASFLNQQVPIALDRLPGDYQVIHLTGKGATKVSYRISSCVKEFEKDMSMAYKAADIAICRSGAGTIAELIQNHIPALLIPFPYAAGDHQRKNGQFLVKQTGGVRLLSQSEATVDRLVVEIETLLNGLDSSRLKLEKYVSQQKERAPFSCLVRSLGEEKK